MNATSNHALRRAAPSGALGVVWRRLTPTVKSTVLTLVFGGSLLARSDAADPQAPPQNINEHLQWCVATSDAAARLERHEGFWSQYAKTGEYEDGVHIRTVRRCAYRIADLYAQSGNHKRCSEMLAWLERNDELLK